MRKIDWIAVVCVVLTGFVMGALWLDMRAMYWSAPVARTWETPNTPVVIRPAQWSAPEGGMAQTVEQSCANSSEVTGNDAVTAPAEAEPASPCGGDEAVCDVPEQIDPLWAPPTAWSPIEFDEASPLAPEPVKVTVTLKDLESTKSATTDSKQSDVVRTSASEALDRFDPLAKPQKPADDVDDPHGTVRQLEDIVETSPLAKSKVLFEDEASREEHRREFRRQLRMEEQRAAASLPPPPPAWCCPPPQYAPPPAPTMAEAPHDIDALRDAAGQMDELANRLERRNLYIRADQLRAAAQELRLDARKTNQ